ncbi:Phosphatidic acid phosphatase/chloroperoxidase, N-terminal [Cynara cardunculus var. scolymus]|uniref:Phosphatidic acid phosphatase/chloroperoxidase, N-terminal n=1 Tax=Cynara cardunculus var. scolymus TaxID=59895 RepID=A0A103YA94_CYNCS|nr:Phosphatidic acid phosphatase/chloroperoxidase, N-terminal [Cynara cardunculus var. scolymus]
MYQEGRVREVNAGAFYLKSHGTKLARSHMYDWLILVLLGLIEIILNIIHPFYRFVGKDMMVDLKYPMKDNTVPVWSVPLYAVLLPIIVFTFVYLRRRDVHDLHHAILVTCIDVFAGLLFAVLITGVLTDAIKDAVGRPRPNFFWRCFPDGVDVWSFAGLGFLALYLAGKIKVFDRQGHVAKLCILFLPLLMASLVAVSRVDDYWHHWQDVFAGGILGWGPYAYFRALEASTLGARVVRPVAEVDMQAMEIPDINQQTRQSGSNGFRQISLSNSQQHDVEFGKNRYLSNQPNNVEIRNNSKKMKTVKLGGGGAAIKYELKLLQLDTSMYLESSN